jgi:hypothetical protein
MPLNTKASSANMTHQRPRGNLTICATECLFGAASTAMPTRQD